MNSRLMYSRVVLVTGTKSVVPGWLAFHWLKSKRPGQRGRQRGPARLQLHLGAAVQLQQPVHLGLERLAREGRHLPRLGQQVEHPQHVEAVVVGEEQLGAVVRARARPGARGPLDEGAHAARRVEVAEVEAGQPRARDAQQGLLQLRERHRRVGARVLEDVRADGHPEADPAALAVEDRLEEGIGEGVHQPRGGAVPSASAALRPADMEGSVATPASCAPPAGRGAPGARPWARWSSRARGERHPRSRASAVRDHRSRPPRGVTAPCTPRCRRRRWPDRPVPPAPRSPRGCPPAAGWPRR